MRIALIGTRGVPAAYGGFETAVEEIGVRLVEAGHEVIVYCRGRESRGKSYRGMTTVDLPAVKRREAETLSHTTLSVLRAVIRDRPDVAMVFNAANSPLLPLLRIARIPCALHTDGLEWQRGKWGPTGKKYYLAAEALGVYFADALISDAEGIADYYQRQYGVRSDVIRYGAPLVAPSAERLTEVGLEAGRFHLVVARLEPENHVDVVLDGFIRSQSDRDLVIVGSVPYPNDYTQAIVAKAEADPRVRMLGSVWDQDLLDTLYAHAAIYFHGHSVGGTNPSLLRAMGAAAPVAAYDVVFNREVLGTPEEVYWRTPADVSRLIDRFDGDESLWRARADRARTRAEEHYRWDDVAANYESLAEMLVAGDRVRPRRSISLLRRDIRAISDRVSGVVQP